MTKASECKSLESFCQKYGVKVNLFNKQWEQYFLVGANTPDTNELISAMHEESGPRTFTFRGKLVCYSKFPTSESESEQNKMVLRATTADEEQC